MKNNTIQQNVDIDVEKIQYSKTSNTIILLSTKGNLVRLSSNLVQIPDVSLKGISKVQDFDIDDNGNLYIVDADGYLYLIESVSHNKKYIGVVDNVKEISVDPLGRYVLTHYHTNPKIDFSFDKPYGYNILSDTKIWDVNRQELIEDISDYKLNSAKLVRNFKGDLMIDAGHFLIPVHSLDILENRIIKRHTIN